MKTTLWAGIFWLLTLMVAPAQTNDLTALLQQGLLEEQANQNLDAAITDYQALATQFDKDRKVAATAVFRIGECYRMQGRTNEAAAQYERVLHDFSDQKVLAQLSRENLKGMGVSSGQRMVGELNRISPDATTSAVSAEARSLAEQIDGIEKLSSDPEEQGRAALAIFPDENLKAMLLHLPPLQKQLTTLTANPYLTSKELLETQNGVAIATSGNADGGWAPFFVHDRNIVETNLLPLAKAEMDQQMSLIEARVGFILENQKARLKVLQAAAETGAPSQQPPLLTAHVAALKAEISELENQIDDIESAQPEQQQLLVQQNYPNPIMTTLMQQLMEAQQQVAKLEVEYSPTNVEVLKASAELNTINSQIDDQIKTVLRGLSDKINADKKNLANLTEQEKPLPTPAPVNDEEDKEIQRIQDLIQNSPDLINAASSGQTELASAAAMGRIKVAAYLLEHGADVNTGGKGSPPLYAAAEAGNRAMVEFLLNHGADVNIRGGADETALHVAAKNKFPAVAEVLLAHNADVNAVNQSGFTPLWAAATYGDLKIVQMLLAAGADPNLKGKGGATALTDVTGDYVDIVQALLTAGANADTKDDHSRTPLSFAAEQRNPKLVKLLLDAKADPNRGKIDAPLLLAILKKDVPSAQLLLEHGADPNATGQLDEMTVMYHGLQGVSPIRSLFLAVQSTNLAMVQLLLKYKADANALQGGWSFLFSAFSDTNILEALLAAGAKVDPISPDEQYETPLELAAFHNQVEAEAVLLKHGANPNAWQPNGTTPLQAAAFGLADSKVLELLLANGADPNLRGGAGGTPLDTLKQYQHAPERERAKQLADLLRQHGARDKLPDWDRIAISRPAIGFTTPMFYTSTNDWNHFTLLEAILAFYEPGRQYDVPEDNNSVRVSDAYDALPFPDLAHIVIVRPSRNLTNDTRIKINVLNGTNGFDLSKDVPLEFGDVVEIPELDHPLGAQNIGLTASTAGISDRLKGTVRLTAGGQIVEITLDPMPMRSTLGVVLDGSQARGILLSSSDLSRVKVTRQDPKTGRKHEWIVDTTASSRDLYREVPLRYNYPQEITLTGEPSRRLPRYAGSINTMSGSTSANNLDLWLRDGDVIEVPEKQ